MPPHYPGVAGIDFAKLRTVPSPAGGEFQAAISPDPAICDLRV
jgi:hypothetical protein